MVVAGVVDLPSTTILGVVAGVVVENFWKLVVVAVVDIVLEHVVAVLGRIPWGAAAVVVVALSFAVVLVREVWVVVVVVTFLRAAIVVAVLPSMIPPLAPVMVVVVDSLGH